MNDEISTAAFARRLKEERHHLELSQQAFADLAGVRRATQYLYENGHRTPTVEYLVKIISAGADLAYLFFGERSKKIEGALTLNPELLNEAFNLVDEIGRDSKGHLLDKAYRLALFESLCHAIADKNPDEVVWQELRDSVVLPAA